MYVSHYRDRKQYMAVLISVWAELLLEFLGACRQQPIYYGVLFSPNKATCFFHLVMSECATMIYLVLLLQHVCIVVIR